MNTQGQLSNSRKNKKRRALSEHCEAQANLTYNLHILIEQRYGDLRNEYARLTQLEQDSGVSRTTLQRLLYPDRHGEHRTSLVIAERLAKAFELKIHGLVCQRRKKRS